MKRIEVKLSLPVVAPLIDVMKAASDSLRQRLASPLRIPDLDADFREFWTAELLDSQQAELSAFLGLFDGEFYSTGALIIPLDQVELVLRAATALRLEIRSQQLKAISDADLEAGKVTLEDMPDPLRSSFLCYVLLASIQEIVIQTLDPGLET